MVISSGSFFWGGCGLLLSSRIKTKDTARTSTSTGQPQTTKNYHPSMSAVDILKNPGMEPSTSGLALNLGATNPAVQAGVGCSVIGNFDMSIYKTRIKIPTSQG